MGETRGEKKKSLGGRGFLLLLPSLSNFEICVALITVNLHWDTVNMKRIFLNIDSKKKIGKGKTNSVG